MKNKDDEKQEASGIRKKAGNVTGRAVRNVLNPSLPVCNAKRCGEH